MHLRSASHASQSTTHKSCLAPPPLHCLLLWMINKTAMQYSLAMTEVFLEKLKPFRRGRRLKCDLFCS